MDSQIYLKRIRNKLFEAYYTLKKPDDINDIQARTYIRGALWWIKNPKRAYWANSLYAVCLATNKAQNPKLKAACNKVKKYMTHCMYGC